MEKLNELSGKILDSCIEVHRHTGPGLIESIYEKCLCKEFELRKINYKCQVEIPVVYKCNFIDSKLRVDLMVENEIIIELKSIEKLDKIHTAQVITYLKLTHKKLGLLINFNVQKLIEGFKRVIR
jgi:GxxExxY protein